LEPVPITLKNPRFCRVLGTGSGKNPKFEKRVPEPVPGNPKFVKRVPKPVLGTLNLKKGSRTGFWKP
jgi:hypothetical protein